MAKKIDDTLLNKIKNDPILALKVLMPGMELPPHQLAVLRGFWQCKYMYNSSGRSTGKTALLGICLMLWAATHPGTKAMVLGTKFTTGKNMFEFMELMLSRYPELAKCVTLTRAGDYVLHGADQWVMRFKNGSNIRTLPADINKKGARVRGFRCNILVIDEAAFVPIQIMNEVFIPCCSITDAEGNMKICKLTTGGYRPSVAWDDCKYHVEQYKAKNPDYYFCSFCYEDIPRDGKWNHILNHASVEEEIRKSNDLPQVNREYYGRWTEAGGSYFTPVMLERNRYIAIENEVFPETTGDGKSTYVIGIDPAFSGLDETALTVIKRIKPKLWTVVASQAINMKTGWAAENAKLVLDYVLRFDPKWIGIDKNGGEQLLHELKAHFVGREDFCPISLEAEPWEPGRRIVRAFSPTASGTDSNTRLFTRLLRALDGNGAPELLIPGSGEEDSLYDVVDMDRLIGQLVNITASPMETQVGLFKYTSTQRKDRVSSLLYAWNAAEELIEFDEAEYGVGGITNDYVDDCAVFSFNYVPSRL